MLNKQQGNMYDFVTHTWNTVKGKCPHDCSYCYMKEFPQNKLRFDKKELKTNLGNGNFIFVGSSCDMFADDVPDNWIFDTFNHCLKHPDNRYFFQTKNTERLWKLHRYIPEDSILCTTIETNREHDDIMGQCPPLKGRSYWLGIIENFEKTVTIEPIMNFDLEELIWLIKRINPLWVSIGADSKKHNLPEPKAGQILELILSLKQFTEVKLKSNLKRLTK